MGDEKGTASVTATPPRIRRSKAELKVAALTAEAEAQAKRREESTALAGQLVDFANTLAQSVLGPPAAMNEAERGLILTGLPSVLDRLSVEAAQKFTAIASPLILVAGVGVWAVRLAALVEETRSRSKANRVSQSVVMPPDNPPPPDDNPGGAPPPPPPERGSNGTGFGHDDERQVLAQVVNNVY